MTAALEVDCTGFVVAALFEAVTEPTSGDVARIVTELPNTLENSLPVVQVYRIGGPNDGRVLDMPTMTVHGFAASRQKAERLLYAAQAALRAKIGTVVTLDGGNAVMTHLRVLGGPSWAAYANTNVRHSVLTIQPRIKITR